MDYTDYLRGQNGLWCIYLDAFKMNLTGPTEIAFTVDSITGAAKEVGSFVICLWL